MRPLKCLDDIRRKGDTFHLDEASAANSHRAIIESHGDAKTHLEFGVRDGGQFDTAGLSLVQDSQRNRMVKFMLGSGSVPQNRLSVPRGTCVNDTHLRPLPRQRARFVKEHRIDLAHEFQRSAILNQNALAGAQRQRTEHCQGRGHPNTGA